MSTVSDSPSVEGLPPQAPGEQRRNGRFGAADPLAAPVPPAPEPPAPVDRRRRRRLRWAVVPLVVLVLLAAAALGGTWWAQRGTRLVWLTTSDVPAGAPVAGHAVAVRAGKAPDDALAGGSALPDRLVARDALPAGSTLTRTDTTTGCAVAPKGSVLVGLSVPAGRGPAEGLRPGDRVGVLAVPDPPRAQSGAQQLAVARSVVASAAPVVAVRDAANDGQVVTVRVAPDQAAALAGPAAAGQLVVVRLPGQASSPC